MVRVVLRTVYPSTSYFHLICYFINLYSQSSPSYYLPVQVVKQNFVSSSDTQFLGNQNFIREP